MALNPNAEAQCRALDPDLCKDRDIYHELFHAMGMLHEHSRVDRDNFVTIKLANIHISLDRQFKKFPKSKTLNMPYDGTSIMHYLSTQGGDPPGSPAILSKVN